MIEGERGKWEGKKIIKKLSNDYGEVVCTLGGGGG